MKNRIVTISLIISVLMNMSFITKEVSYFIEYKQILSEKKDISSNTILLSMKLLADAKVAEQPVIANIKLMNILKNLSDIRYELAYLKPVDIHNKKINPIISEIRNLQYKVLIIAEHSFENDSAFISGMDELERDLKHLSDLINNL